MALRAGLISQAESLFKQAITAFSDFKDASSFPADDVRVRSLASWRACLFVCFVCRLFAGAPACSLSCACCSPAGDAAALALMLLRMKPTVATACPPSSLPHSDRDAPSAAHCR